MNRPHRWYHYLMTNFPTQALAVLVSFMVVMIQMGIYDSIDVDTVVFQGKCDVEIGGSTASTKMMCGDDEMRPDPRVMADYLHSVLTQEQSDAIVCVKTVSEYLATTNWSCKTETEEL